MRSKIFFLTTLAGLGLTAALSGCGGSRKDPVKVEPIPEQQAPAEQKDELREAVTAKDRKTSRSMADELALNADDLSPDQAVSVLMTFYDAHLQYSAEHKNKSDMETMRKFVDVYDIVSSNHGAEFRKALKATSKVYPDKDFTEVYKQFVDRLAQYDGSALTDKAPEEETPQPE